jgi:hypothetical protein
LLSPLVRIRAALPSTSLGPLRVLVGAYAALLGCAGAPTRTTTTSAAPFPDVQTVSRAYCPPSCCTHASVKPRPRPVEPTPPAAARRVAPNRPDMSILIINVVYRHPAGAFNAAVLRHRTNGARVVAVRHGSAVID